MTDKTTRPASTPTAAGAAPTARLLLPADAPEAEWHAVRRTGLGGSNIAAVLGMDRYRGPLHVWEEKHGRGDHTDSEAAECGRELEDVIARLFGRRTGYEIAPAPGTLQHTEHTWMLANLDRLVIEQTPALGIPYAVPLECKNRSEHQARDWDDDVPDGPALQLHWYLAVTGYTHGYVAALIGGNRLRHFRLERDEELVAHLVDYCGTWWQRHVVEGVQPDPDGSQATTELLAHLWEVRPDAVCEVDPAATRELLTRRAALKDRISDLEHELAVAENRLKAQLGEAEIAVHLGRELYSWKANGTFAPSRFTEAHPELAAAHRKTLNVPDWDAIKAAHPETYRAHRARVLRVPSEGSS